MSNLIYIIFTFITIPLLLTLAFLEKHSRKTMLFLIIGICECLLAAKINTLLISNMNLDFFYYSSTISPIVEEVIKAIPLILYIIVFKNSEDVRECVTLGLALGVGFALFENIVIYCQNNMTGTLIWAITRGIGASLMHTLCTGSLAYGCYFIYHHRYGANLLLLSILLCTIIYHGLYNCMVQSNVMVNIGLFIPLITYLILYVLYRQYINRNVIK